MGLYVYNVANILLTLVAQSDTNFLMYSSLEEHSFGYWLRLRRKALDLTQDGLADRVGCSVAMIRKIEADERYPSAQIIERLAEVFSIPQTERTSFLRFARGNLQLANPEVNEPFPWSTSGGSTGRMLEVRFLGTFDVKHKKKPISISSRPAQSLFAYLLLNAGSSHRREKLAGLLWPDFLEETARGNLRHALWQIRKSLPSSKEYLVADGLAITFNPSAEYWLDVAELEKLSDTASADEIITVLSQYQGELLPGFYDEWVISEREHLYSIFEHHTARLMSLLQGEKRWLDILNWGERWIKLGQKPEPAYRALMIAQAAKGDMSKVAATYERCVKSLKEFGIEPSEQTKELYKDLKAGKDTNVPKGVIGTATTVEKEFSSNIPVPLTSFVGREQELKEITRLLFTSRLITLTGSGGVGKTRLAIYTAHNVIRQFKDGVYWVGLVGLSDENLIPQEIAASLKVGELSQESVIETLKVYLKSKELLIVLDNCEHLIRGCASYSEQLLAACPRLKILATSTEALGLFNETAWQVPSLPLPTMQQPLLPQEFETFASVELFVERAQAANLNFALTDENSNSVAQICNRLDGIPLAIELAAARIKVLSVDEIAARLGDRFSLLTAGSRTAISRHQTLRATINWSYDLLTEPERILFHRLATFAGGFTLDAAEAVCSQGKLKRSDVLDVLGRLVDKSLVIVEQEPAIGATRYRLLETIRQFALEKLVENGEAPIIRDNHLGYYVALAETAEPHLATGEGAVWFPRLDQELDNIRAAFEWSTNLGKADAALRIAGSLAYYWFAHRLAASEWHDWVQKALARPESNERTLTRAKALNAIGLMYFSDVVSIDRRPELEEALTIAREFGDPFNTATALSHLGLMENLKGNYQAARTYLEQGLAIWRQMGPVGKFGRAWTLVYLGDVALNIGAAELARTLYEEVISILRELGELNFLAYAVRRLGHLLWRDGAYEKAIALCKGSLNLNKQVDSPRGVIACLTGFAAIAVAQGKYSHAVQIMAAEEALMTSMGVTQTYMDRQEYDRNLDLLRDELDEKTLVKLWAKGGNMSLDQAVAFALEEA